MKLNIPSSQRINVTADVFHYVAMAYARGDHKETLYATINSYLSTDGRRQLPPTAYHDKDIATSTGRILTDCIAALAFFRVPVDLRTIGELSPTQVSIRFRHYVAHLCDYMGHALRSYARYDFEAATVKANLASIYASSEFRAVGSAGERSTKGSKRSAPVRKRSVKRD